MEAGSDSDRIKLTDGHIKGCGGRCRRVYPRFNPVAIAPRSPFVRPTSLRVSVESEPCLFVQSPAGVV
jgi:hypothetical protein